MAGRGQPLLIPTPPLPEAEAAELRAARPPVVAPDLPRSPLMTHLMPTTEEPPGVAGHMAVAEALPMSARAAAHR